MFRHTCTRPWANRSQAALYSTRSSLSRSRLAAGIQLLQGRSQLNTGSTAKHFLTFSSARNDFESLGIYPPLAANLKSMMTVHEPTLLQRNFIPPILKGKDVLIRDTTGSGKTFGVLLALLSKPRRRIHPGNRPGITSVIMVPNREVAFQLQSWTQSLFPAVSEQQLQELIQVLITLDPPLLSQLHMAEDMLTKEKGPHRAMRMSERPGSLSRTIAQGPQHVDDEQYMRLTRVLPHVLVATPTRLWNLMEKGILDLSGIETLVLDEVDHLIRLPRRFASQKKIGNRDRHPKPAELALRGIVRSAQAAGRYGQSNNTDASDRIQIIASSATMNRPVRYWLESHEWIQNPEWIDTTKSVVLPKEIEHHCVVVGTHVIRNMRLESDEAQRNPRNMNREESDQEVDWAETDNAWIKDKDANWKERQLAAPGVELETRVEKFLDDDDRMLESVAMAVMLDNVENACVFFCSHFSLGFITSRLRTDFGLSVYQLQKAFGGPQIKQNQRQEDQSGLVVTKPKPKGIFVAHESNARGLDLPGLSHVYIVGLPSSPSSYVHMAGRTGRMGCKGQVVTILRDDGHLEDRARSLFKALKVNIQPFVHVQ